jgi:hypothetical protein
MAISSVYTPQPPTDVTGRLYRGAINTDPRMVVDPYADPGDSMPLVTDAEANPARHVQGVARIGGGPNALTHPLLLELLRQRTDLAKHFMQQNQLMMPQ